MSEPLVLINLFAMPADQVDGFVERWEGSISRAGGAGGFRGTTLHRAIDPDAPYPVVNIARWDSVEEWRATVGAHFVAPAEGAAGTPRSASGVAAHPALYTVVHVTPDPQETR
jgi:heme-degrading monooxygenase HmoA